METIKMVMECITERKSLELQLDKLRETSINIYNNISLEEFSQLTYEECKYIFDDIQHRIKNEVKVELQKIKERKKTLLYPELLNPTYYPELDTLNIPSEEKLALDKEIAMNTRFILNKRKLTELMLINAHIKELESLGIVEKTYSFKCRECGLSFKHIKEDYLNKLFEIWELEARAKELTKEEEIRLDTLHEQYCYGCITAECYGCDDEFYEISSLKEFEEAMKDNKVEVIYRIIKRADLTYDKK